MVCVGATTEGKSEEMVMRLSQEEASGDLVPELAWEMRCATRVHVAMRGDLRTQEQWRGGRQGGRRQ